MYKVIIKDKVIESENWADIPNAKISSLILLSPDKSRQLEISGFSKYICMKEALLNLSGQIVLAANICYGIKSKTAIKFRVANDSITSTMLNPKNILANIVSKNQVRSGVTSKIMI